MKKLIELGLAGLTAVTLFAATPQAFARGDAGRAPLVFASGACSAASTWKLTVTPENGKVEADFEVDTGVVGQTWKVRLFDNGVRFFSGSVVTKGPDGSFEVRKLTADRAGSDTILAQAKNPTTGETCQGTATL